MTPLKLVDQMGDILGAIVIPDRAMALLFRDKQLVFYPPPPSVIGWSNRDAPPDVVEIRRVVIIPSYSHTDAVMIADGTLWDFERCGGCYFIPGYDFIMKGRC